MSAAKSVVIQTIYNALADGIAGATVFQDVPDNFIGAIVVLGGMKSRPLTTEIDPDREIDLLISSQQVADESAPVVDLMEQIETLLIGRVFTPPDWKIAVFLTDTECMLDEDGKTYVGTTMLRILALSTL